MTLRWGTTPTATHRSRTPWSAVRLLPLLLTAALGLAIPAALAGPASAVAPRAAEAAASTTAATGVGHIYVIHGIVGRTLDIYVDGKKVLSAAKPKTVVGPLALDAGSHQVALRSGSSTVAQARFSLRAGQDLDVIAHLRSDSSLGATVTAYDDDLAAVGPGKLRLVVAHVAAAPPADIKVNGTVLFSNVANGQALTEVVPSATYKVEVDPAASAGAAILGPVSLTLARGTLTRVYAVGNVTTGSMDAIVHVLPVSQSGAAAPSSVPTGTGGQAASELVTDHTGITEGMLGLALLLLAGAGVIRFSGRSGRRMRHSAGS